MRKTAGLTRGKNCHLEGAILRRVDQGYWRVRQSRTGLYSAAWASGLTKPPLG